MCKKKRSEENAEVNENRRKRYGDNIKINNANISVFLVD